MRLLFIPLLALATAGAGLPSGASAHTVFAARADTIFRYVSIGRNVPIRLGEAIPDAARPLLRPGEPGSYDVAAGAFSGAENITVRTAEDGRVWAVAFTYAANGPDFEAKVDGYTDALGTPSLSSHDGIRSARWEDGRTRFELMERNGRTGALLIDLGTAAEVASARARPYGVTDPCSGAGSQLALNACGADAYTRADGALRRTYERVLAGADSGRRPALREAQKAWERFREAHCRASASRYQGGSMYPMQYSFCLASVTEAREEELRADERP